MNLVRKIKKQASIPACFWKLIMKKVYPYWLVGNL